MEAQPALAEEFSSKILRHSAFVVRPLALCRGIG
jgi:hypothetical protein